MNLIFAVVLVVGATAAFTLLIRTKDVPPPEPVSPTAHLEERKAAIYENLRDLQFEYRVGKLSDDDYQRAKVALQKELAVVIGAIAGTPAKTAAAAAAPEPKPEPGVECPHCGAHFSSPMKFCGECGKAMA
jgi:hypothetical protein